MFTALSFDGKRMVNIRMRIGWEIKPWLQVMLFDRIALVTKPYFYGPGNKLCSSHLVPIRPVAPKVDRLHLDN